MALVITESIIIMVILAWAAQNFVAIAHFKNFFISRGEGFHQNSFP